MKEPSFFEKLYTRVLNNPSYDGIIEWRKGKVLLVFNIPALEDAIHKEGVCDDHVGYDSISRQFRVYRFNRPRGSKELQKYPAEAVDVWIHEYLASTCTLEDIKAVKRNARVKDRRRSRASEKCEETKNSKNSKSIKNSKNSKNNKNPKNSKNNKEITEITMSFTVDLTAAQRHTEQEDGPVNAPTANPSESTFATNDASPNHEKHPEETGPSSAAHHTNAAQPAMSKECSNLSYTTSNASGAVMFDNLFQWPDETDVSEEEDDDDESSSGSSFGQALEDMLAVDARSQMVEDGESQSAGLKPAFEFADGGIFFPKE